MPILSITYYWLECDTEGCDEGTSDFDSQDALMAFARQEGWHITKNSHTCPKCYAKAMEIFDTQVNRMVDYVSDVKFHKPNRSDDKDNGTPA